MQHYPTGLIPPPAEGNLSPPPYCGAPPAYFPPHPPAYPPAPPTPVPHFEILKPRLPVSEKLDKELQDGTLIKISGHIPKNADRFHVNLHLKKGKHEKVDAALHVNPRFQESTVVRNSFLHKSWGTEETHGRIPLTRDADFELIILSTNDDYRVAFNGTHFCEFPHRVAMDKVKAFFIDGDVKIHSIQISNPSIPEHSNSQTLVPPSLIPPPIYNLPVPFRNFIYNGGFVPGRKVIVQGIANNSSARFAVNFQYFQHDTNDIAFHFNPRFNEHEVVMNTLTGHNWGKERRPKEFPFVVGAHFAIEFECHKDKIKISVNSVHFCDYVHRLKNLKHIEHLSIKGDVMLSRVDFL